MLYGGVNYRLKANPDNEVYVPWAGRVVFAPQKEGEGVKMQFYQVYLVSISFLDISVLLCGWSVDTNGCRILRLSRGRNKSTCSQIEFELICTYDNGQAMEFPDDLIQSGHTEVLDDDIRVRDSNKLYVPETRSTPTTGEIERF
jgi:hypothetical protein